MRRGFTLIELMVVIAIMGILSTVAVPKLTVVIAKSKASEVVAASATYIKLQDAYVIEHRKVGSWKRIGYSAPKSNNFNYVKGTLKQIDNGKAESLGTGWTASNRVPFGDCLINNLWSVDVICHGTDSDGNIRLEYKSDVTTAVCAALTSGWGSADGERSLAGATSVKITTETASTTTTPASSNSVGSSAGGVSSGSAPAGTPSSSSVVLTQEQQTYNECSKNGTSWLHGQKNGSAHAACNALREQLEKDGDLVCETNKNGKCTNNYVFKDKETECRVTGNSCS